MPQSNATYVFVVIKGKWGNGSLDLSPHIHLQSLMKSRPTLPEWEQVIFANFGKIGGSYALPYSGTHAGTLMFKSNQRHALADASATL